MIDLGRAIQFNFKGDNVITRAMVGALMMIFVPIFFISGFLLLGYQVRIIRGVMDGDGDELPDFSDPTGDFMRGVMVFGGTLLFYLPAFILAGLGGWLVAQAISEFTASDLILAGAQIEIDRNKLGMAIICFATAFIWLLLSAPLVMAAVARYAETGKFNAFIRVLELADEVWLQKRAAASLMFNLFILALLVQVANMVVSSIVCFAGAYLNFLHFAAICHLNGQWGAHLKQHRPRPNVIRPLSPPPRR